MKCFASFLITSLLVLVSSFDQQNYIRYNGVTIRIQHQPQVNVKRKLPSWVDTYKKIESKHASQKSVPSIRATRTYKPFLLRKPTTASTDLQRKIQHERRLAINRKPIMNFFYNRPETRAQQSALPSLNSLISQSYYSQLLNRQRINKMFQDRLQQTQRNLRMQNPQSYINQQLDKKDIIRSAVTSQYQYPYWGMYYNQPQTRSLIPSGNSFYSNSPMVQMQSTNPFVSAPSLQRTNYPFQKYQSWNTGGKNNFNFPQNLAPRVTKGNIPNSKVKSNRINLLNKQTSQSSVSNFKGKVSNKSHVNETLGTVKNLAKENAVIPSARNVTSKRHRNVHAKNNVTKWTKDKNEKRTLHKMKHNFHQTQINGKLGKRGYLSSPQINSFEDEVGEFPMEETSEEEKEEGRSSDPFSFIEENNERNMNEARQQMPDDIKGKSSSEIPLLNIETPDTNEISPFAKKQIEELANSETNRDREYQKNEEVTGVNESPEIRQPPTVSQIQTKAEQNTHVQHKEKLDKEEIDEEEQEALKEDKVANTLIKSDINKLKVHDMDKPDLPSGFSPQLYNKDDMKLAAENIASQNNEIGIESSDVKENNLRGPVKFSHEELGDEENDFHLLHDDHLITGSEKEHGINPFGENTEDTIANLEEHDFLDSDKIVKTLSHLKEPPNTVALGNYETRKLMKNEENTYRNGLVLNGDSSTEDANLLDPVKAQERSLELLEKYEQEKLHRKEIETSTKRPDGMKQPKDAVKLSPEDAMNALDGKPLPKADTNQHEQEITNEKTPNEIKLNATQQNRTDKVEKEQSEEKKPINDFVNQIQTPLENNNDIKSTYRTGISNTNNSEVIAKAMVSGEIVDLLKGMGQIKSDNVTVEKEKQSNTTMDVEEKETKEAVKDLNAAIGILEKKLTLINQAKAGGDNKDIHLVDNMAQPAVSRSNIDLDNSLKLLEKVMNVATRVEKRKKESIDQPQSLNTKVQQRNKIERAYAANDLYTTNNNNDIINRNNENFEELQDEKRDKIYKYPISSKPVKIKRNYLRYYQNRWIPQFPRTFYRRTYKNKGPSYWSPY